MESDITPKDPEKRKCVGSLADLEAGLPVTCDDPAAVDELSGLARD